MQQRSAYPFGTAIKLDKFNVPEYQFFTDFVLKHFNWAVIANKLKWYGIERIQVSFIKRSLVGEEKWNRFYLCWHCIRTYIPVPNRSVNICTCMVIVLNLNNNIPLQDQSDYTSVLAALDVLEANGYELSFLHTCKNRYQSSLMQICISKHLKSFFNFFFFQIMIFWIFTIILNMFFSCFLLNKFWNIYNHIKHGFFMFKN